MMSMNNNENKNRSLDALMAARSTELQGI
jgi:hypothetical protein